MTRSTVTAAGLGLLLVAALAYPTVSARISLYRLESANPVADAERALAQGDSSLAAVDLFRIHVPGFDAASDSAVLAGCALHRVGRYTSDLMGSFPERYNGAAMAYAKAYNEQILRRVGHCMALPPDTSMDGANTDDG